jgi:acetolactate synthase-1/2/3 large subunit
MSTSTRVVDYIVDFLSRQEVRHVFGVGGANIEDLYDAVYHSPAGIHTLVAKHEFSAATMADGYYRAGGRIAPIIATSGAGAMNLVPGLAELRASGVPALALIGQPPTTLDGYGSFQETSGRAGTMNAVRLFSEIGVFCARLDDPHAITDLLPRALAAALDPARPGPAILLMPKDMQQASIPPWPQPPRVVVDAVPITVHSGHERAVQMLRSAIESDGVVVVAGEGVARADARPSLARLADALDALVAVVPDAKDVFDTANPRNLGVIGPIGSTEVRSRLEQASAVVLIGTRLPQMAGAGLRDHLKGVPVICIDSRAPFLDDHTDLVRLSGPLAAELDLLAEAVGTQSAPFRVPGNPGGATGPDEAPLSLRGAVLTLAATLPEGVNVVADAGNTGATAIHHVPVPEGGRFIAALGMGGMGHSFGAGIGAAFATGRRTYVLAGDGAFFMHGMEVHTAVEQGLPVTFVIFNNNAHGMCWTREQLFYAGDYTYNVFSPAHIGDGIAALLPGLDAVTVRDTAALQAALAKSAASDGPALICVDVDHTEMPPFQPFLAAAAQPGGTTLTAKGVPG